MTVVLIQRSCLVLLLVLGCGFSGCTQRDSRSVQQGEATVTIAQADMDRDDFLAKVSKQGRLQIDIVPEVLASGGGNAASIYFKAMSPTNALYWGSVMYDYWYTVDNGVVNVMDDREVETEYDISWLSPDNIRRLPWIFAYAYWDEWRGFQTSNEHIFIDADKRTIRFKCLKVAEAAFHALLDELHSPKTPEFIEEDEAFVSVLNGRACTLEVADKSLDDFVQMLYHDMGISVVLDPMLTAGGAIPPVNMHHRGQGAIGALKRQLVKSGISCAVTHHALHLFGVGSPSNADTAYVIKIGNDDKKNAIIAAKVWSELKENEKGAREPLVWWDKLVFRATPSDYARVQETVRGLLQMGDEIGAIADFPPAAAPIPKRAISLLDIGLRNGNIHGVNIDTGEQWGSKHIPGFTMSEDWTVTNVLEKLDKALFSQAHIVGAIDVRVADMENGDVLYWVEILQLPERHVVLRTIPKRIKAQGDMVDKGKMLAEIGRGAVEEISAAYIAAQHEAAKEPPAQPDGPSK